MPKEYICLTETEPQDDRFIHHIDISPYRENMLFTKLLDALERLIKALGEAKKDPNYTRHEDSREYNLSFNYKNRSYIMCFAEDTLFDNEKLPDIFCKSFDKLKTIKVQEPCTTLTLWRPPLQQRLAQQQPQHNRS